MKKVLAILLSVVMLLGCVAFGAFAEEGTVEESTAEESTAEESTAEEGTEKEPFEISYPETAVNVASDELTSISVVKSGLWFEYDPTDNGTITKGTLNGIDILEELRTGDVLTFKINIEEEGTYDFVINFVWGWDTEASISVDDGEPVKVAMGGFINWETLVYSTPIQIDLTEGDHDIKITHTKEGSGAHIEGIAFGPEDSIPNLTGRVFSTAYELTNERAIRVPDLYSYRVKITEEFESASLWMPTWKKLDSYCTFAIYEWQGNYEDTIYGESIVEEYFDPMGGDGWRILNFDPLPAGEYVFHVFDCGGSPGVYTVSKDDLAAKNHTVKGITYLDGEPTQDHVPHLKITTVEPFTGDDLFEACSLDDLPPVEDTTAVETTVAETTVAETTVAETTVAETTVAETTVAETTVAETTAVPVADTTAAPAADTTAAAGTKAPAATTAAETSGGCGSVVASASVIALVAVASAAAVVLKKKED